MKANNSIAVGVLPILLIVFGFVLVSQGMGSIFMQLLGLSVDEAGKIQSVHGTENLKFFLLISQFGASVVGLMVVPVIFLKNGRLDLFNEIQDREWKNFIAFLFLGVVFISTAMPIVSALGSWNKELIAAFGENSKVLKWEEQVKEMYSMILHFEGTGDLLLVILVVAILPGVAEEFVFRGILQNELKKYLNPHLAIVLTALVFSLIHFQFIGIFPRWYLGIVLGYLYLYSGNIYVSMVAHFFNNFIAIMAYYLYQNGQIQTSPEKLDAAVVPIPLVMASVSFGLLIWIRLWRMRNQKEIPTVNKMEE